MGRKYYVTISSWERNYAAFSADFRPEEDYEKDEENKVDLLDVKYEETNRFDAFRVLSTVFNIIKDFYEYNIKTLNTFMFTADDKRKSVYKKIINKLFPTWKLTSEEKKEDGMWRLEYEFGNLLTEGHENGNVRNNMTPKSAEEIDEIINHWTPREKFLRGFTMDIQYLKDEGRKDMKPFSDVKTGDLLTIAVPRDATKQPLCEIKEKHTFNNKEEFKDYLREHPGIIIDSNKLKMLFKIHPEQKSKKRKEGKNTEGLDRA
jgi:hypothetical protein